MEINAKTKIDKLLKQYPFLENFLITLSPKFKGLKNPIMRKTMGKVATLEMAAPISGLKLDSLISSLTAEIEKQSGSVETAGEAAPASQGEPLTDPNERRAALKGIIKDLHDGGDMEVLKTRFRDLIQGVDAPEIAKMEQELMNEGMSAEEIKRLCDVHVEIFKEALEEQDRPEPPLGHPIHTYMKENRTSEKIMSETSILMGLLGQPPTPEAFEEHSQALGQFIEQLSEINTHYTRKENQLFPMLEAHHFTGPSQVMWSIHDDIRANMKQAREAFAGNDPAQTITSLKEAIQAIRDMIYKEEHILFPTSLDMLTDSEWIKVKEGEADIGFAWVVPDKGWPDEILKETVAPAPEPQEVLQDVAGALGLDTGRLTLDLSKEDKDLVKTWRDYLAHNQTLKCNDAELDPERLKGLFELYFEKKAEKDRRRKEKYVEFSLENALSQVFSPKQKELFKKKLEGLPLNKTEQEYYSRTVKKKVVALANSELHSLSKKLLEL